eukprot:SAG11_NODE_7871_length_1086_cov_0.915907_1_plen_57_part_01
MPPVGPVVLACTGVQVDAMGILRPFSFHVYRIHVATICAFVLITPASTHTCALINIM